MSLTVDELDWASSARCADMPSEIFYTNRAAFSAKRDEALECCNAGNGCPARRSCLAFAIAHREDDGTWGGMLCKERSALARTRCRRCHTLLGRPFIAAMILDGRQHAHCPHCGAWVEVIPSWEYAHRNSWITGTGRRT